MKLIIQIPCYNEESTLEETLRDLPRAIPGISQIEILIIDDGSTDQTIEVARNWGVDHVLKLGRNRGLAAAHQAGLDYCLAAGADVIVNTDADNQYRGNFVPALVKPIVENQAELVIGCRPFDKIKRWTFFKKQMQKFGSFVISKISGTCVKDATSGFRAMSREFAENIAIQGSYSYTLEAIIFAGTSSYRLINVPIEVNSSDMRPSRLMKSQSDYIKNSVMAILRSITIYRSFEAFFIPGILSIILSIALGIRFLKYYFTNAHSGHTESLILASGLFIAGLFFLSMAVVADLIVINRRLLIKNNVQKNHNETKTPKSVELKKVI